MTQSLNLVAGRLCLITGRPGVGKTTLIRRVAALLGERAGGFYTEEVRAGGSRLGFRILTLDGQAALLASAAFRSPIRVGRYGVDLDALDRVGVAALLRAAQEKEFVIVDEIGKMELLSPAFREAVSTSLESGRRVLGTITQGPHPWAEGLKARWQPYLLRLTEANREQVWGRLLAWLEARSVTEP